MIAQNVAEIPADHVRLTVEGIDRMYLHVYVPRLQCPYGVVSFFRDHRGQPLASSVLMSPMSRGFVAELDRFAARHRVPVVLFAKGQRKDDVMARAPASVRGRSRRRFHRQGSGAGCRLPHREAAQPSVRPALPVECQIDGNGEPLLPSAPSTAIFGPFFLKFRTYFSYNAKLCLNGHEYAKRQLAQQAIACQALAS
jgi:hypothetical protein